MLTTIICTSLRGYFGCCALHGAATPGLIAALSQIANWRRAILIIDGTKSKSVQQLPLPDFTGKAVAQLITRCRASTPIWHIAASAATKNQSVAVALNMETRFTQHFLILSALENHV